jgi:alpha-ketoglutarate-dependent taurine dioxygenase
MRLLGAETGSDLGEADLGEAIARDGLVLLRNATVAEVRTLLSRWTEPVGHPHDVETGLTVISPRPDGDAANGLAGFTRGPLAPHTDRSLDPEPPSLVVTVLDLPGASGGEALLVDGARVLATLRRSFDPVAIAGLRLRTADGATVPIVETTGGLTRIRYRADPVARPHSVTGDRRLLAALDELIATPMVLRLDAGDGYLVHNHRYLHGRSGFTGARRLTRMLARLTADHQHAWLNRGFIDAGA